MDARACAMYIRQKGVAAKRHEGSSVRKQNLPGLEPPRSPRLRPTRQERRPAHSDGCWAPSKKRARLALPRSRFEEAAVPGSSPPSRPLPLKKGGRRVSRTALGHAEPSWTAGAPSRSSGEEDRPGQGQGQQDPLAH
uniref:Uncharacterized protein n=1 Tax=Sphaerodactylus townsendi TaxID=933632 RepID=A0ACB8GE71_9SAUR